MCAFEVAVMCCQIDASGACKGDLPVGVSSLASSIYALRLNDFSVCRRRCVVDRTGAFKGQNAPRAICPELRSLRACRLTAKRVNPGHQPPIQTRVRSQGVTGSRRR